MLEICAMLFQFGQLHFGIEFLMRMSLGFMFVLIVLNIVDEVMIASNDNFMLIGQGIKELDEAIEFSSIAVGGKVTSMDEDVSFRQFLYFQILMQVMGVAHGHDSNSPTLLHFMIIALKPLSANLKLNSLIYLDDFRQLPGGWGWGSLNQNRISDFIIKQQGMKRPQSAKMGMRGYWGQTNGDEASEINSSTKNFSKKQVVLMKPDLTSHDFSRILPKKIHQDKQRLYSQTLQLKQSLNEVTQQNIRLKTKISILEKEKTKLGKYYDNAQDVPSKKSQSRLNLYTSKISDKQNNIIQNLKKLVRESKEEVEYLKLENIKIKKTMKYTKVNEVEIEKKILFDENKRISQMLEDLTQHINDQSELERENRQLKKYLEEEMEENKIISEENQKYEEIVEELENKIRSEVDKYQNKEKKANRDFVLEKRKNQENQKYIEDLRRELNHLRSAQAEGDKPKPVAKPVVRPTSSIPNKRYNPQNSTMKRQQTSKVLDKKEEIVQIDESGKSQTEEIKVKNTQLEQELKDIKSKLQRSENELKERAQKQRQEKENLLKARPSEKQQPKAKVESNSKRDLPKSEEPEQPKVRTIRAPSKPQQPIQQSPQKKEEQSYNQGFEKQQEEEYNYEDQFQKVDESKDHKLFDQIQKVKEDFEENQEEEQIYKKKDSAKDKAKAGHKKKKQHEGSSNKKGYKPNKKVLSQIKELLTYRMKSQRYPFDDLKSDIESANSSSFTYTDLCDMFVNEPFHLTPAYTKVLLNYCYESDNIKQSDLLKGDILVAKLRKVIEEFQLMDEEEEKEMIIRISDMTCSYPHELEAAFDEIKNGEETVSKANLIEMFEKLELERKYIELIISELSLCSDDLEHLNFHGFFERFYIDDDPNTDHNDAIEEQGEESEEESYRDASRKKKSTKNIKKNTEEDEDYSPNRYMQAFGLPESKNFNDDDIVSDDGRI